MSFDLGLAHALSVLLEERHVSRAARRLGLTQSAASRVLARLRVELSDPLLIRAGRGYVLSPRAARMQAPLERGLATLTEVLADEGRFEAKSTRRSFRIATVDYGVAVAIVPLMHRLSLKAPGLSLSVVPLRGDFDEELATGALDLVIAPRRKASSNLVWSKLSSERFVSVLRAGHPCARRRLDLDLYCALSHVVVVPEPRARNVIDELLAAKGLRRHVALRLSSFLAAPLVVAESDLVLTTPESVARRFAKSFQLVVHPAPIAPEPLSLALAFHERQRRDAGHGFLRSELLAALRHS